MMKKRMCALLLTVCVVAGLVLQFPLTAAAYENNVPLPDAKVGYLTGDDLKFTPSMIYPTNGSLEPRELDYLMSFQCLDSEDPDDVTPYDDWRADFELIVSENVYGSDGFLAGNYGDWLWVVVEDPNKDNPSVSGPDVSEPLLKAGEPVALLHYAGIPVTYKDIRIYVKSFLCGLKLDDSFWDRNEGKRVTIQLTLKLYEPTANEELGKGHAIGPTYVFTKGSSEPHVCKQSHWFKNEQGHYKTQCGGPDCPLGLTAVRISAGNHTFGADDFCTVCGYLRDTDPETAAPKTGDVTHTLLWTALFMGGMAVMWMQLSDRKREMF